MSKKPQEDGRGGEGGTADNIVGEVGSIPPYPTFIPPGPKKLFCPGVQAAKYPVQAVLGPGVQAAKYPDQAVLGPGVQAAILPMCPRNSLGTLN